VRERERERERDYLTLCVCLHLFLKRTEKSINSGLCGMVRGRPRLKGIDKAHLNHFEHKDGGLELLALALLQVVRQEAL
jgi:hypothetical protein